MSHMATIMFDVICLATGYTKHLYPAYSGCIRFKSLCPQALRAPRASPFKPDTSLVDHVSALQHEIEPNCKDKIDKVNPNKHYIPVADGPTHAYVPEMLAILNFGGLAPDQAVKNIGGIYSVDLTVAPHSILRHYKCCEHVYQGALPSSRWRYLNKAMSSQIHKKI